jgi:chemotaxis protein histidine kinase CheA
MNVEDRKFEIGSKVRITRGVCIGREGVIEQIEHEVLFVDIYYIRCYKQLNERSLYEDTLSEQWIWKTADAMELVEDKPQVGAIEIPIRTLLSEGDFEQLCTSIAENVAEKLNKQEISELREANNQLLTEVQRLQDKLREQADTESEEKSSAQEFVDALADKWRLVEQSEQIVAQGQMIQQLRDKLKEQADAKSDEEANAQELIATLTDIRFKADMTEKIESQAKELKQLRAKVKEQKKEIYRLKEALNAAYREINGLTAMAAQNDKVIDLITSEEYKLPLYRQRETLRYLRYIFDWYNVKLWLNNDKLELVGDGEQKFTLTLTTAPGFGAEDAERVLKKLEKGQNV